MVGGGSVQVAGLQAVPQGFLMPARAEGRAHHIARRRLPVGVLVHAVIQQQMPGQYFAIYRLALTAGVGNFVECFTGRHMHQIQRRANGLGNADRPAGSFAFHLGRARQRVRFRPGHALGHEFALQVVHQFAVFGMHSGDRAQFQATLEAGHQGVVGGHDRVLVGHEVLEAVDAVMADQLGHLFAYLLAPPGDGDMKAVVGCRLFGPAAPLMKSLQQGLLRVGNDKVDNRCSTAGQTGCGATEKVFAGDGAHKWQLHVSVGVNTTRYQILAAAIEHFAVCRNIKISTNCAD